MDPRLRIRPTITTAYSAEKEAEVFQNNTLRPVLKLQNDLLVNMYQHYMKKRKIPFASMQREQQRTQISNSISKDNRLRGLLFGMIIGHFTTEELQTYLEAESEMNRRITSMLIQRLQDQLVFDV
ncbi:MAG: hypothetical protein MRY78_13270 [Saprospiraceae bacterium]|nr:hypothetical protein [Saprospiraceae bacterium]